MALDDRLLLHNLPRGGAIFLVARAGLEERMLLEALEVLERLGTGTVDSASLQQHYRALRRRLTGADRWDSIVRPYPGQPQGAEAYRAWLATIQTAQRAAEARGYCTVRLGRVTCVLDLFNPRDELELGYAGAADETVLQLMLADATTDQRGRSPFVQKQLASEAKVYSAVRELTDLVEATSVCGGTHIARVCLALKKGEAPAGVQRPWDPLWTLSCVSREVSERVSEEVLRGLFAKRVPISGGRELLQLTPGFGNLMSGDFALAADLLGMIPWTALGGD